MESCSVALQHCMTTGKSAPSPRFPSKIYPVCLLRLGPIPPIVPECRLASSLCKTQIASH